MTFTYSGTASGSAVTTLHKVRLHIGDTDSTAALFTDEEINIYLADRADNVLLTAADLCEELSARFARYYTVTTDGQTIDRKTMSDAYARRAKELRSRASGVTTVDVKRVDGYSDDIANQDVTSTSTNPRRRFYGVPDTFTTLP